MRRGVAPVAHLSRAFFARGTVAVARDLIGCALVLDPGTPDDVLARIVEVEAYLGVDDPASHAYRGPTRRAAIMFGDPGHLYVYLSYGVHHCANIVTEPDGVAGAVLLRAASVERGEPVVRTRRGVAVAGAGLLRGPGNLCLGLGISLKDNGVDLCDLRSRLSILPRVETPKIATCRRVGIKQAADRPLRFVWAGHASVSKPKV